MSLHRLFTDHPRSVDETYVEHMGVAFTFAVRMLAGAAACAVHAVLPFLFVKTGSAIITDLHDNMVRHRDGHGRLAPSDDRAALQQR